MRLRFLIASRALLAAPEALPGPKARTAMAAILSSAALLAASALHGATPTRQAMVDDRAESSPFNVWVASDIHYLAESLHDSGPMYQRLLSAGDNKNIAMARPLLDALAWTLARSAGSGGAPGCLVITGDLSLNGERESHLALAKRLEALAAAGIPVYVLPGNHDIANPQASSYFGDEAAKVPTVSPEEFARIYASCGYGRAISRDRASLSYLVQPRPGLMLLLLDSTSTEDNLSAGYSNAGGELGPETRAWISSCAARAKVEGSRLVVAMHHSLVDHNELINSGYTIADSDGVAKLFSSLGIRCVLSGHTHIQDIAQADCAGGPIYDITTGALSVYPHYYGRLSLDAGAGDGGMSYESRSVDVAAWAKATGCTDSRLLAFDACASAFFRARSSEMMASIMDSEGVASGAEARALNELLVTLNARFFSGREDLNRSDIVGSPRGELLKLLPEGFLAAYAASILNDSGPAENALAIR